MCQGFSHLKSFLHHFVLAKLATSSIRVKGHGYLVNIFLTKAHLGKLSKTKFSSEAKQITSIHSVNSYLISKGYFQKYYRFSWYFFYGDPSYFKFLPSNIFIQWQWGKHNCWFHRAHTDAFPSKIQSVASHIWKYLNPYPAVKSMSKPENFS